MATSYTTEAGHVQWGPIDGTFDLPILAQLRAYLGDYAWIFPDERLYQRFVEAIKGLIAARVPIVAQTVAAVIQSHDPKRTFHVAKRYYRWLDNQPSARPPVSAEARLCPDSAMVCRPDRPVSAGYPGLF
jgi:hypothetical protein